MEVGESILDVINEELSTGNIEDVEMMDVEDGEVVDGQFSGMIGEGNEKQGETLPNQENPQHVNDLNKKKRRKKKKKNKKQNAAAGGHSVFDLDRFVLGVGKRLREKKTYLLYTAVGVLGVSALTDLVNEVGAIQACGGQMTAEGNRYRTGGGILWNILRTREPNAYKEIMKKGKEFEKQFRRPWTTQAPVQNDTALQDVAAPDSKPSTATDVDLEKKTPAEEQPVPSSYGQKRRPVHERIRVPVSYDDLPGEEPPTDQFP